tara:strand:+ start:503 stop:1369 length:867 start_codon:yes stop_codon:yes gene_type:complete
MKVFKFLRYSIETIVIIFFFSIFKILGLKNSSIISGKIFKIVGHFFRPKKTVENNLRIAFPNLSDNEIEKYILEMWEYYGKIFAEYIFLSELRNNKKANIKISGIHILEKLKINNDSVVFISGHFDNFELMAMYLEKSGIKLSAIYRPLNNFFMNTIMEKLRTKYICKKQIKKGRTGIRESLRLFKEGYSIALMIDQRVSEGPKINFFNKEAYTTTVPAQFVKKFNCKVVPINIVRTNNINFEIKVFEPFEFKKNDSINEITLALNKWLENTIIENPSKWIWSHNRWK